MKRILIISAVVIILIFSVRYCMSRSGDSSEIEGQTGLIQQQIVNVGKLVVTEGHFAEVLTFKDQDKYLLNMISFDKKALIIVNADVTVAYDLRKMEYKIDQDSKTIRIKSIPKEEVKISPDIKFYDVEQSKLNPFTGDDYNKINVAVKKRLAQKIEKSSLKSNAENRLVSELSKILILTNSMGWTLEYEGKPVNGENFEQTIKD